MARIELPDGVSIIEGMMMPMRDGVNLACDVYRPPGTSSNGTFPLLLLRTPYGKFQAQANDVVTYPSPAWLAGHGYIVVVQDVRGRHDSGGVFYPLQNEETDGFDTIDACANLSGCNGKVGMYGMSYPGFVQLAAASSGHPALACIAPGCTAGRAVEWALDGGAERWAFVVSWGLALAADEAARQGMNDDAGRLGDALKSVWKLYAKRPLLHQKEIQLALKYMPFIRDWLTIGSDSEYWQYASIRCVQIPSLFVGGWYDMWSSETVKLFTSSVQESVRVRLLMGLWAHAPWRGTIGSLGGRARVGDVSIPHVLLDWFDWNLKDIDPDSWLLRGDSAWFDRGEECWRFGDFEYEADDQRLGLRSDGTATVSPSGRLVRVDHRAPAPSAGEQSTTYDTILDDPLISTPSLGGWSCCYPALAPIGPQDQNEVEALSQVSVYSWECDATSMISGWPSVSLSMLVELIPTTVIVTLTHVKDGESINVSRGVKRISFAGGYRITTGLIPIEAQLQLKPVAFKVVAGETIRLLVHGSSFPEVAVDPHIDTATALVHARDTKRSRMHLLVDECELRLPMVGAAAGRSSARAGYEVDASVLSTYRGVANE